MGWVAALFVGLLAWLLAHDVRSRETAIAMLHARRDTHPRVYWLIMAFWVMCLLLSALLTLGAYIGETMCERQNPCVVTIKAYRP